MRANDNNNISFLYVLVLSDYSELYNHCIQLNLLLTSVAHFLFLTFSSALLHAGYRVSMSHAQPNSVKTNAPNNVIWVSACSVHKCRLACISYHEVY